MKLNDYNSLKRGTIAKHPHYGYHKVLSKIEETHMVETVDIQDPPTSEYGKPVAIYSYEYLQIVKNPKIIKAVKYAFKYLPYGDRADFMVGVEYALKHLI